MEQPQSLSLFIAFAAGLLSFLSPCVLPLVPSYVGFLTGLSLPELAGRRRTAVLHAVAFVLGFTLVFILLGAGATAMGRALSHYQVWVQRAGAVLIILFGLVCLGALRVPLLQQEQRVHLHHKPVGYVGSGVVGMAFAAGWTPCIGPVLGAILGLAATQADVGRGVVLLATYSAGLAVPFLLAAVALGAFLDWFQRFRRYLPWVMRASGALLVFVGVLMLTGHFTRLSGWLQGLTPELIRSQL